jgi:hypothetical protein
MAATRNEDADLRALLETLDPKARDDLRRFLIRDQADRDAIRTSWNLVDLKRDGRIGSPEKR